jgi:hypothetical protein
MISEENILFICSFSLLSFFSRRLLDFFLSFEVRIGTKGFSIMFPDKFLDIPFKYRLLGTGHVQQN